MGISLSIAHKDGEPSTHVKPSQTREQGPLALILEGGWYGYETFEALWDMFEGDSEDKNADFF